MGQDKSLVVIDYARRRMSARGLNDNHIWFCMFNHKNTYKVGQETVWVCVLPDGRNIKVRVEDENTNPIIVKEAFTYH